MSNNPKLGGGGLHHVAVNARDFDRSVHFYRDLLGCTEAVAWGEAPKRAILLDSGDGSHIELFEKPNLPAIPEDQAEGAIIHYAIKCNDPDSVIGRVREAGYRIRLEPKDVDIPARGGDVPVRIAFFFGPDNEIVELFHDKR